MTERVYFPPLLVVVFTNNKVGLKRPIAGFILLRLSNVNQMTFRLTCVVGENTNKGESRETAGKNLRSFF
jgi:hypothetical protein